MILFYRKAAYERNLLIFATIKRCLITWNPQTYFIAKFNENFIKKLHQKSGKDIGDIQKAVQLINALRKDYYQCVEEDLININNAIEKITN